MEHEILIKVNKFRSQHPELQSPAADHTSGTSRAAGDNIKAGAFRFKWQTLPKFGGSSLREYPTFKKDWANQVASIYSEEVQLFKLRGLVPEKVRVDVKKFTTTVEFWEFMDVEFGNKELVRDCLAYLRNYKHPKEAKTDAQKFQGMYRRFSVVYSGMQKVDSLHLLDHPASIQEFMSLLPADCRKDNTKFLRAEPKRGLLTSR